MSGANIFVEKSLKGHHNRSAGISLKVCEQLSLISLDMHFPETFQAPRSSSNCYVTVYIKK